MVNFGGGAATILGIFIAVAGAALYFMRSVRPELSRDQDIFFAAIGLLCGAILLFQGWRLDPILLFGQFLLAGSAMFFAFETLRLRGTATEQAKRRAGPIVDEERRVSKVYRYEQEAELDELEPAEERYVDRRRLRGTEEPRSSARERYEGEGRRPRSRGDSERLASGERPRKSRSRPSSRASEPPVDAWEADMDRSWEEKPSRSSRSRPTSSESRDSDVVSSKPRRRRPPQDGGSSRSSRGRDRDVEARPSDSEYVDYQPIDYPEEERDSSGGYDY